MHEVPPGVDIEEWRPQPREAALAALVAEARRDPPNPGNANERLPDDGNAERLAAFLAGDEPTVVYFGKLLHNKGVHVLLEALEGVDARTVVVGFGDYRAELQRLAAGQPVLFTGPLEHRHLVHLLALADACVVPSIFPEAFGMVAAEAAAAGCPPLVARHSGLAEVAEGLEAEYPPALRGLTSFTSGDAVDLRRKLDGSPRALAGGPGRAQSCGAPCGGRALELEERCRTSSRARSLANASTTVVRRMGDEQRLSADELITRARERFEAATDFTIAVEEEFAILDPETLDLTNRFEDVQAAAPGLRSRSTSSASSSPPRSRSGPGARRASPTFPARWPSGARSSRDSLSRWACSSARPGRTPGADWKEQRIIDTPHYRRNDELLRYVVWRNNTFGLHVHVAVSGADRPSRSSRACATSCPSCSRSRRARRSSRA